MPCYDPRDSEEGRIDNARKAFRHNSDIAEMLCDLMKRLDPADVAQLPLATQQWWVEHQQRDAARSSNT